MSRAPGLRGALWIVVAASALQSGCIHNHYYGTQPVIPGCPPPATSSTVTTQVGSICDVPSGQVAAVASSAGTSRVVISQPALGPPSIGQSSGRIKWKKPDPETIPPMKAEGGLDDSVSR
jgi:hypothetical protein